jgi:hypothetical protein
MPVSEARAIRTGATGYRCTAFPTSAVLGDIISRCARTPRGQPSSWWHADGVARQSGSGFGSLGGSLEGRSEGGDLVGPDAFGTALSLVAGKAPYGEETMPRPRLPKECDKTASQQNTKRVSANRPADIFEWHYMLDSHTMLS